MRGLLAACLMLLSGCATWVRITPRATILIDRSFTVDQMIEIEAGVSAWEAASPDVHFKRQIVDHDLLMAMTAPPPDTFRLVVAEAACVVKNADGLGATTHLDDSIACFNAKSFPSGQLAMASAHEIGHQLGLTHVLTDEPSVMHVNTGLDTPGPTCSDVERAGLTCTENATGGPK